jgi:YD repeat-containing protein
MKGKHILLSTAALLFSFIVSAQYNEILTPQSASQMELLKSNKVTLRKNYILINGGEGNYGFSKFDADGRLLVSFEPLHRQYFTYDDKGRVTACMDSLSDGRRFMKTSYSFTYNADGKLSTVTAGASKSIFQWNDGGSKAVEKITAPNGLVSEKKYTYNSDGKLILIEQTNADGRPVLKHKLLYNQYGDLASEIRSEQFSGGETDSSTAIYSYDGTGRLITKKEFHARIAPVMSASQETSAVPEPSDAVREIKSQRTDVTTYIFNLAGVKTGENTRSTNPKFSTKTDFDTDNLGLLQKYTKYDAAGKVIESFRYIYR